MAFNLTYKTVNHDFLLSPKQKHVNKKSSMMNAEMPNFDSQKDMFNKFYASKTNPSSVSLGSKKGFYNMNRNRTTLYLQNRQPHKKISARLGSQSVFGQNQQMFRNVIKSDVDLHGDIKEEEDSIAEPIETNRLMTAGVDRRKLK